MGAWAGGRLTTRLVNLLIGATWLGRGYPVVVRSSWGQPSGCVVCTTAETTISCEPTSVAGARNWALVELADWYAALGDVSFAVQMVMSELVTNAIEADASRLSLALDAHHSYLRIEVTDDAPGLPVEQEPEPDLSHGRGLMIVGALSSRWGVERQDDGMKTVWAELPLTPGVVPTFACAV